MSCTFIEEVSRRTTSHTHSLPLQHEPPRHARQTVLADVTALALSTRHSALVAGARCRVDIRIGRAGVNADVVGHASEVKTSRTLERVWTAATKSLVALGVARDRRRLLQRQLQRKDCA